MKKIMFLMISVVIGVLIYQKEDEIIIPSDAIRVRIIANSNDISDLYAKKKLKEEIKNDLYSLVENVHNVNEAEERVQNGINEITKLISSKTNDFSINYGMNYFPKKSYRGVIYPEGEYNSLVITLGKGLGDNWWCVLYPPLCMIEDNENTSDVEYRLYIKDVLSK